MDSQNKDDRKDGKECAQISRTGHHLTSYTCALLFPETKNYLADLLGEGLAGGGLLLLRSGIDIVIVENLRIPADCQ